MDKKNEFEKQIEAIMSSDKTKWDKVKSALTETINLTAKLAVISGLIWVITWLLHDAFKMVF